MDNDRKPPLALWIALPIMAAAGAVLTVFAETGEVFESLPRPLVTAVLTATVLQVGFSAGLGLRRGAALALVAVVFLVNVAVGLLVAVISIPFMRTTRRRARAIQLVSIAAVLFFSVSVLRATTSPAFNPMDLMRSTDATDASPATGPDIFVILVDGYPRSDTLDSFGYHNDWFEQALADRGFEVAPKAHSNYGWTYTVLPTMFHMRHLQDISVLADAPRSRAAQRQAIRAALSETPATEALRQEGYAVLSTGLPAHSLTLRDVDNYLGDSGLTVFEHQVLTRTSLGGVLSDAILRAYRDRTLRTLDTIEQVASDPRSTFLFAHLWNPHVPFVFDRNGGLPTFSCGERCDRFTVTAATSGMPEAEFKQGYVDQIDYLNGLLLTTIDVVIADSPNSVVVLFSDHGTRLNAEVDQEWFKTFFAARTPGREQLFSQTARPLDIFPVLLDAYFGRTVPLVTDDYFASPYRNELPLSVVRWTGAE